MYGYWSNFHWKQKEREMRGLMMSAHYLLTSLRIKVNFCLVYYQICIVKFLSSFFFFSSSMIHLIFLKGNFQIQPYKELKIWNYSLRIVRITINAFSALCYCICMAFSTLKLHNVIFKAKIFHAKCWLLLTTQDNIPAEKGKSTLTFTPFYCMWLLPLPCLQPLTYSVVASASAINIDSAGFV